MGSHSLYVTAWCSAIAIFLASWYSRSSSQWGLRRASSRARRLCSLSCRIWKTVSWGFWFTLTSPANRHVLRVFILIRYLLLLSVSRLLQTNVIAVTFYRSTVVFQTSLCFHLLQLSEITFPLATFSCISRSRDKILVFHWRIIILHSVQFVHSLMFELNKIHAECNECVGWSIRCWEMVASARLQRNHLVKKKKNK